jgi:hypothetical protein
VAAAMIVMVVVIIMMMMVMMREITCSLLWLEGTLYPTSLPCLTSPPPLKKKKKEGPPPGLLRCIIVPVEAASCP